VKCFGLRLQDEALKLDITSPCGDKLQTHKEEGLDRRKVTTHKAQALAVYSIRILVK